MSRHQQAYLECEAKKHLMTPEQRAEADSLELTILLGRAGHQVRGGDEAVAGMREGRSMLSRRGDRAQLYLLAAEFYEAAGRYDDAIDAYGGRL